MLPIIIANVFMMGRVSRNVMMLEDETASHTISNKANNIKDLLISAVISANNIAADERINYAVFNEFEDMAEYYDYFYENLREWSSAYYLENKNIADIKVYTDNKTITQGGNVFYLSGSVKRERWYRKALSVDYSVSLCIEPADGRMGLFNSAEECLSIIRRIGDKESGRENFIKLEINLGNLYSAMNETENFSAVYLYDSEWATLLDPSGELTAMDVYNFDKIPYDGEDYIEYSVGIGSESFLSGWQLIGYYDVEILDEMRRKEYMYAIGINTVIAVVALLLVYAVFYSFKYRMKKVETSILNMSQEKFEPVDEEDTGDEIGQIITAYNNMSVKINTLINDVYKLEMENKDIELEKTRAELKYLQSQVDPHFLFNVLNALLVASVKNGYTKITPQISNLAKLLRRLLYWPEDSETIGNEIQFIEMYLQIEKFRFEDIFDYTINVDENLYGAKIPKMAIQPVVENACRHGLQGKDGKRNLKIDITERDGRCYVRVEDNGIGMNEDTLKRIKESIEGPRADFKESIGLKNVYQRLKMYFGDDLNFDIQSEEGIGTTISISFRTEK